MTSEEFDKWCKRLNYRSIDLALDTVKHELILEKVRLTPVESFYDDVDKADVVRQLFDELRRFNRELLTLRRFAHQMLLNEEAKMELERFYDDNEKRRL